MNVSSVGTYTSALFEPKEHPSACQCPGCCKNTSTGTQETLNSDEKDTTVSDSKSNENRSSSELTASQRQELAQLQQRDSEVRAHEAAHIAAGGSVVSGAASFTYQKGPDGKLYAIGGEVPISSSGGNTPEEKIAIAKSIQAGALAPANPSPQDLKVASSAAMMEAQARQELNLERSEALKEQAINTYSDNQNTNKNENSGLEFKLES